MINTFQTVLNSIRATIHEANDRLTTLEDRAGFITTRVDEIEHMTIETQQVADEATKAHDRLSTQLDELREQPPLSPTKPSELTVIRQQVNITNQDVSNALSKAKVAYTKATALEDKIVKADLPHIHQTLAKLERNQQELHPMPTP